MRRLSLALASALAFTTGALWSPTARAQTAPTDRVANARHSLEAGLYLHQLSHPGAVVGYSFRALTTANQRHALILGVDLGTYVWLRHDFGVFALPRVGYRFRATGGFQAEVNAHVGYLQGLLASESVTVEGGSVVAASRVGYPYLFVGPSAGVGYAIARVQVTPFVRVGATWQLPLFEQSLMRLFVLTGVEVALR